MSIDQVIAQAFKDAVPVAPLASPDAVVDQVLARMGDGSASVGGASAGGAATGAGATASAPALPSMFGGAVPWIVAAAAAAGVGLGVWWAFGTDGPAGEPIPGVILDAQTAPVFICPAPESVLAGELGRGDRVLAVARTADGEWLQVRHVRGALEPVFIRSSLVVADDSTADLPVVDCEDAGTVLALAPPEPSVPTAAPEPAPEPDGAQQPNQGNNPSTGNQQPAPPQPPPPDTTPPSVGQQQASTGTITEQNSTAAPIITCAPPRPQTSTISAVITDNVGVTSATIRYTVPGASQVTRSMSKSGNTWSATMGPVPPFTVADDTVQAVTVTITAHDGAGNSSTATVNVSVESIWKCFG
ncbi:MAG: hypothetical protein CVT64_10655 [Actinobacteria bacterium HGW-Actinobacteria-4]|nr:MAG: hypothetical protein CVT64_10655 [Actinobacteria bacterium HGW-Actinobacteria-4]